MRNLSFTLVLLILLFTGIRCVKNTATCSPKSPAIEAAAMQAFAASNSIIATTHSSGLMYEIVNMGSGPSASASSTIYITYTGRLLDGTIFDQQTNSASTGWPLNQLIEGWRVGVPLIQKGGQIKLIVPSSMAYGCTGYGIIPANSILYFDITLVNVL